VGVLKDETKEDQVQGDAAKIPQMYEWLVKALAYKKDLVHTRVCTKALIKMFARAIVSFK